MSSTTHKKAEAFRITDAVEIECLLGYIALVSSIDEAHVRSAGNWQVYKNKGNHYAYRRFGAREPVFHMHHFILGKPPKGYVVDHLDGNGLNNCRSNLRFATYAENNRNKPGLRGVRLFRNGRWVATIKHEGKAQHLGYFDTKEEATAARVAAEKSLWSPLDRYRVTHGEGLEAGK